MSTTEEFHSLVSGLDYPMFVVTAAAHGDRAGCLVGFTTQASIHPPRLLVLLSKSNRTYQVAEGSEHLAVHFLHDGNRDLSTLFGEATGDEVDKFAACEWHEGPHHTPILSATRGWVLGRIVARLDAGDHVGHLLDVELARTAVSGRPLMFQAIRDMDPGHPA
jgi:flavin reductase (DIM6/NTAB) family NADH-FMN oxidoreductase RutF